MHNTECRLIWTGKYTVCRCVWARLSPENWQFGAVNGLVYSTSSKHKSLVKHGFCFWTRLSQRQAHNQVKILNELNVSQYTYSDFTIDINTFWQLFATGTCFNHKNTPHDVAFILPTPECTIYIACFRMSRLARLLQDVPFLLTSPECPISSAYSRMSHLF